MDIRSVIAVLGAIVITFFLSQILEGPMVGMLASKAPANMDELILVRNEANVLLGRLAIAAVVGVLAGYLVAKIAGHYELAHAAVAAALQAFMLLRGFAADPPAASVPFGMRAAFVAVTVAAMLAGAAVRARAARVTGQTEVRS